MGYSHDSEFPFAAFITNLGKYNEGELVGEWVKFPTTPEKLQEVFERIGIGSADDFGNPYEEWFITDYDCYVDGLYNLLGEYENLDELNYLASKLEELGESEYEHFQAAMEISDYTGSLKDLINLTDNLDKYDVYPGIDDYDDLGRYYIDELGTMQVPEYLQNYIDYEAYGRDIALGDTGAFTDYGYVYDNQSRFEEYYDGDRENIPEEYRVMVSPEEVEELEPDLDRLDVSTELALDLDLHFRGYSADYEQAFPKEQVQREAIADALLDGNTSLIKTGLLNMSREMDLREETSPLIGRGNRIDLDNLCLVEHFKESPLVQEAVIDLVRALPDLTVDDRENFLLMLTDPKNHLKNAEVQVEDDYGMIDGIINNGERSKDKEPGMDKPSVLGQLSQAKKECAERKPPELGKPGKDEPEL